MNSVPNSDLEQCTESRLSWVHLVHTLTQAAFTGHAHCTQAAMSRPCHGPMPDRIVACGRPCRRSGRPCRRPQSRMVAYCHAVSQPLAARYHDTWSPPSQPRYNCCIATQLPAVRTMCCVARAPDRILSRVAARCCRVATLYRSPGCAVSRHQRCPSTII